MSILEYIDPEKGENGIKDNLTWFNILALLVSITVAGVSYGASMLPLYIGAFVSGLVGLKLIFNNRKNISNLTVNLIKIIKNGSLIKAIKRTRNIDTVLYNAITKEPPDLKTIEMCLNGRYWSWKKFFGYEKADVNKMYTFEEKNMTMLHLASKNGKKTAVDFLLEKGADKRIKIDDNMTPLKLAIAARQSNCIDLFSDMIDKNTLLFAAEEGNQECIEKVLEIIKSKDNREFKDIVNSYRDEFGNTLLHIATGSLNADGVNVFLRYGANPTALNNKNKTPLMFLHMVDKEQGKREVMALLLQETSLFSLSPKLEDIVNVKSKVKKLFFEKFSETKNIEIALQDTIKLLMENSEDRLAKIAVIGEGGAGKSSLINALKGEVVARASNRLDETKYPQEYLWEQKLLVDFPGFGTSKYEYKDFKKHFQGKSFDLIILVVKRKPDDDITKCVKKVLIEKTFSNMIFVRTFYYSKIDKNTELQNIQETIKEATVQMYEHELKKTITDSATNIEVLAREKLEEYEKNTIIRVEENKDLFFADVETLEEARQNSGFRELESFINTYCSPENLKKVRLEKHADILDSIKEELIKNSNCPKAIKLEWNMAMASIGYYSEPVNKAINMYLEDSRHVLSQINQPNEMAIESKESKDTKDTNFIILKNILIDIHKILTSKVENKTFLMTLLNNQPKDLALLESIANIIPLITPLDMTVTDESGKTLLMYAAKHTNILTSMLQRNRHLEHIESKKCIEILNMKDSEGKTTLINAVIENNIDTVKFILDQGTEGINIQDNNGKSALMHALEKGSEEIIKLLLEKGAMVSLKDNNGRSVSDYSDNLNNSGVKTLIQIKVQQFIRQSRNPQIPM